MLGATNNQIRATFLLALIAVAGALATFGGIAVASNTTGALHTSIITFLNTGTLRTNYAVAFNMSGSALVDDGFITSNGLNALLTKGGQHMPGMPPTNRIDLAGAVQNDGGVFTDYTTQATSSATNDVPLLPPVPAQTDEFYFGMHNPGRILSIDIGQPGVGNWTLNWQYRTSAGYVNLSNVIDGTNAFKKTGRHTVSFTMPTDWLTSTVTGNATSAYWIRAQVASVSSTTTQPLANRAWWENGQWWTWDDSLDTNQEEQYTLNLGGPAMVDHHQVFPGTAGIITPDSASLELGNTYVIQMNARLSYAATGSGICVVCKEGAIKLYPSASNALTLTVTGAGTTTLTLSGLTLPATGSQTVKVTSDSTTLILEVVGQGSVSGTSQTVTNTANNYVWGSNGAVVFFDAIKVSFPAAGDVDTFDTQGQWNTGTFSNTESAGGQPTDMEKRFTYFVEASSGDGEWIEGSNEFFNTSVTNRFGYDGAGARTSDNFYARFVNIPIAQGTTISDAYMTFEPSVTGSSTTVNVRISAIASDNAVSPGNFTEAQGNPRTTAFTDWNNVPTFTANTDINSISFTNVIQEIINRPGWASGNAIVIYIEDNGSTAAVGNLRTFRTFDTSTTTATAGGNTVKLTIVPSGIPTMADDFIRASDVGTTTTTSSTTNDPLGWNGTSSDSGSERQIISSWQVFGNYAMRLQAGDSSGAGSRVRQDFAALPGQTWGVGAWAGNEKTNNDVQARLSLVWLDSGSAIISQVDNNTTTGPRHSKTLTGIAPANTAFARIELFTRCNTGAGCSLSDNDTYWDGAIICECASVPAFTDASNKLTNPSFEKIWTSGGIWTSPNLAPTNTNVSSTSVTWTAQEVSGTTLLAETSINNQVTWQTVTNGGSIPGISSGQDVSSTPVHLRFTIGSTGSSVNLVTPFIGLAQVNISSTTSEEMRYELNTLPSNTIADRTGHGHTGTMSFPVQLTDITTIVGPLRPTTVVLTQEQALGIQAITAAVTGAAVDSQIFNTDETGSFLPGWGLVKVASDNARIPIAWFWSFFGLIAILATGVLFSKMFSQNIMVPAIAMGVMILFWGLIGNALIPLWVLFIYVPIALALLLLRPRLPL
ncbi:MAG: hypothetical protein ACREQA_20640 [Candidatus Binatia bacterium]